MNRPAVCILLAAAILAAAGCTGLQFLRTARVTGETLEGTYESGRTDGGKQTIRREYEFPPLPVYAPPPPPIPPAQPQPGSKVPPAAGTAKGAPAPGGPMPLATAPQLPIAYVPGGKLTEYLERLDPSTQSEKTTGKSKGASSSGPPGSSLSSGKAPQFDLKKGKMSGSTSSFLSEVSSVFQGPMVFVWLGGVTLLAGLIMALAFKMVMGWWIALAGGVVAGLGILTGFYPWVALVAAVLVLLGGLGFLLWARKTKRVDMTLNTVVAGVEAAPAEASAAVKTAIGATAAAKGVSAAVKGIVSAAKAKLAALGVIK